MSTKPKRYTRFELMDTTGRVVVHCGNTQSLEQDECRTLKVFIDQPARVKDAELIQALVDQVEACRVELCSAIPHLPRIGVKLAKAREAECRSVLEAAAAAGFKPFEP